MTPRRRILPIFVPHAGCPNDCVFCNQKRISGSLFPASGETVREALSHLPAGETVELAFYGGSFTAIPAAYQQELLDSVEPFRLRGTVSSIRISTRPDAMDDDIAARLKKFGVQTVELGAQSMYDEVLFLSGRGHTAEDTRRAAAAVKAAGLHLILQMMTGLPGSTDERDLHTAKEILRLRPDGVRIYPTVIIRDTALADAWQDGSYREHTVEDAVRIGARLLPLFENEGIPVIRYGLNPTEELSGGAVLGGAYHPALGELVRSRIWLEKCRELLSSSEHSSRVIFGVRSDRISAVIGQHRCNLAALKEEFSLDSVSVRPAECGENSIILL